MSTHTVALNALTSGPSDAPVVVLGAALGTTLHVWEDLAEELEQQYRVVRYDTRGHGESPRPLGPYEISDLADDVVALADSLGVDRFAYLGLSISGAVGQQLALDHADRLRSLLLCSTAPRFADEETWRERADLVRSQGPGALVDGTRGRWFTEEFLAERPGDADRVLAMLAGTDPEGYAGCCEALGAFDATDHLGRIATPTRVVGGTLDPTADPETIRALAEAIPGADHVLIDDAAHLAHLARPEAFLAAVREHLDRTLT